MPKEEKESDIFSGEVILEKDIPKKSGRESKYDWEQLLSTIKEGEAREVDTKKISKATIQSAIAGTDFRVTTRTQENEKGETTTRVFIRHPKKE